MVKVRIVCHKDSWCLCSQSQEKINYEYAVWRQESECQMESKGLVSLKKINGKAQMVDSGEENQARKEIHLWLGGNWWMKKGVAIGGQEEGWLLPHEDVIERSRSQSATSTLRIKFKDKPIKLFSFSKELSGYDLLRSIRRDRCQHSPLPLRQP